jgi:hypothetical protein
LSKAIRLVLGSAKKPEVKKEEPKVEEVDKIIK